MTDDGVMNEFDRLIDSGEIQFNITKLEDLEPWAAECVSFYFYAPKATSTLGTDVHGTGQPLLKWAGGNKMVGRASCIKVNDEMIKYIMILPVGSYDGQKLDQFVFFSGRPFDDDHGVTPDVVSMYLIEKGTPGTKATTIKDNEGNTSHHIVGPDGVIDVVCEKDWKNTGKIFVRHTPREP